MLFAHIKQESILLSLCEKTLFSTVLIDKETVGFIKKKHQEAPAQAHYTEIMFQGKGNSFCNVLNVM